MSYPKVSLFVIEHYNFAKESYEHFCTMVDLEEAKKVAKELSKLDNLEKYYDGEATPIEDCDRQYRVTDIHHHNVKPTVCIEYVGGLQK